MSRARRRSNAARFVAPLRRSTAIPEPVLHTLQVALERGNVSDPVAYLEKIIRFHQTGTWLLTRLDGAAPHPVIEYPHYPSVFKDSRPVAATEPRPVMRLRELAA